MVETHKTVFVYFLTKSFNFFGVFFLRLLFLAGALNPGLVKACVPSGGDDTGSALS